MPPKRGLNIKPGGKLVEAGGEYYNVGERALYYDTIAVASNIDSLGIRPAGWFTTFAALGAGVNHSFFDVRNKGTCELAFCNLDTRDQTPFGLQVDSIGCIFKTPNPAHFNGGPGGYRQWLPHAVWGAVLAQHASLTLRVQQDDKLTICAAQAVPGFGTQGGGYGQGPTSPGAVNLGTSSTAFLSASQGVPSPEAPFQFTKKLNIPRHASISVKLSFTEYARQVLQVMPGPGTVQVWNTDFSSKEELPVMFSITLVLAGKRLVQQRGALHR